MVTIAGLIIPGGAGKATIALALSAVRCLPRPLLATLPGFMTILAGQHNGQSLKAALETDASPAVCYRHFRDPFLMSLRQLPTSSMKLIRTRDHLHRNAWSRLPIESSSRSSLTRKSILAWFFQTNCLMLSPFNE